MRAAVRQPRLCSARPSVVPVHPLLPHRKGGLAMSREWEDELRQAIVLADMYGASREEIAAVFERAMREVYSR